MTLFIAALGVPALAHGTFVDARPLPGVEVGGTVSEVELLFPEEIVVDGAAIRVTAPDGSDVPVGGPIRAPVSTLARVAIEPLTEPGEHRVDYAIPSADGTVFEGSFLFTYSPDADPLEPLPFGRDQGTGVIVLILVASAAGLVAGALGVRKRSRSRAHPPP